MGGVCSVGATDSYDVTYYKPVVERNYLLDRNEEYTQVLHDENGTNVYGKDLIQKNSTAIVNDYNGSVIVKTKDDKSTVFNYSDYGKSNSVKEGHAYNGEMQDLNGLIYLRAKYYDPSISRFVQVDKNYDGEKEVVASQNKYIYTLNNPYKYVDRDGNTPRIGGGIGSTGGIACVYPPNLLSNLNNSAIGQKIKEEEKKRKEQEKKDNERRKQGAKRRKELQDLIKKYAQEGRWDLVAALLASGMLPSWARDVIKGLVQKSVNPTTTCPDETERIDSVQESINNNNGLDNNKRNFVNEIYKIALDLECIYGIPAAVTTAQAVEESYYGQLIPIDINTGKNSYNIAGVKGVGPAGSVMSYTEEEVNGARVQILAEFRAYHSFRECLVDRSEILVQYYKPHAGDGSIDGWINALVTVGYATNSSYASNLYDIIYSLGLR